MKRHKELIRRYIIFFIGLLVSSFGVSLVTRARLGTSPISSIPYVLSIHFNYTLGQFTMLFSILLILLQVVLLKRKFPKSGLLQIPVAFLFGYFIDLAMFLTRLLNAEHYGIRLVYLAAGCIILGYGVFLQVYADVVMLPGEALVKAIVITLEAKPSKNRQNANKPSNFERVKVVVDITMVVFASILSLLLSGQIVGVREGTLISAVCIGNIAGFFKKVIRGGKNSET